MPAERFVSGGFFDVGGREDGGVTLNGRKWSTNLSLLMIILWRYADQLRIPGSTREGVDTDQGRRAMHTFKHIRQQN